MSLREYQRKRDFSRTSEPRARRGKSHARDRLFVIQKHFASRLHYDFRLELEGALKSWAVPKGVPFAHAEKRLAARVEDHPLEYASFEGIIPEGQYGGGTVMVWDTGTWEPLGGDPKRDLEQGKLHFALHGRKLSGEWTLVRMRGEDDKSWLLIKSGEAMRPVSKKRDDESILTGRTMSAIARDRDAKWESNRCHSVRSPRRSPQSKNRVPKTSARRPNSRHAPSSARFVRPMMAKLVSQPPRSADWIYELKFDGFRALALKDGREVELLSRNEKKLTQKFPEIAEAVGDLPAGHVLLDGEIVALDAKGRSSFQLLQQYELGEERPPLCYYVFDLLHLDGRDMRECLLAERKSTLESLLREARGPVRFSAAIKGDPRALLKEVKARGLEGIIGKKRESRYESGRRSGAWIKLKCVAEQEFVIGGYTAPQGTRRHFGALLVGYHDGAKLKFAGKVGTGFNAALLRTLHARFQELKRPTCPFADLPEKRGGRWSQNITPAGMRKCTWVRPELVCEVKFSEWTQDGKLRQPVFIGLRDDKPVREVVRETKAST